MAGYNKTEKEKLLEYLSDLLKISGMTEEEIHAMLYDPEHPINTIEDLAKNLLRISNEKK